MQTVVPLHWQGHRNPLDKVTVSSKLLCDYLNFSAQPVLEIAINVIYEILATTLDFSQPKSIKRTSLFYFEVYTDFCKKSCLFYKKTIDEYFLSVFYVIWAVFYYKCKHYDIFRYCHASASISHTSLAIRSRKVANLLQNRFHSCVFQHLLYS